MPVSREQRTHRTKRASDASTSENVSKSRDGVGGKVTRTELARHDVPRWWMRSSHSRWEQLSSAPLQSRKGYSSPPNGTKVEDRNTGTRLPCPVSNWARRAQRG